MANRWLLFGPSHTFGQYQAFTTALTLLGKVIVSQQQEEIRPVIINSRWNTMKKSLPFYLLLLLISCTSHAATINFDDITTGSSAAIPGGYQGYEWVGYDPFDGTVGGSVSVATGNNATVSGAYSLGSTLGFQISRSDGMAFNALDFFAAYDIDGVSSVLTISGFKNGSLSQITTASFSNTATSIPVNFLDIDLLRIETPSIDVFSIDNLVVTAVPVPPALWLFGSGLLGLVGIARRKKTV